ncbi:1-phosphofructokinase family hexose kinase [Streptacidiphilus neutrinimicus]|uniref:1-phosphofructokinase family hexose kinase n=1 Tax=Streptacidiphilus neutrinimicus TaxID=105420 RepID=UPI0005A95376|nr:PfkB family carbohydrate kinase [Streptacidiphilus neutrinimicus]
MIVTVTLNAALDVTYVVAGGVRPGATHRVGSVAARAGGKGVNTARVLASQGEPVLALGFAGGASGAELREELDDAGVPHRLTAIAGATRRTVAVVDATADGTATGGVTGFWEPGPQVTAAEWTRFLADFRAALPAARAVVLSGSLPPGVPRDAYAELVHLASDAGVPTLVDADADALREALRARPTLVKPNAEEALRALGPQQALDAPTADREAVTARPTRQPPGPGPDGPPPSDAPAPPRSTRGMRADTPEALPASLARRLVSAGAGAAVVSAGAEGLVAWWGGRLLAVAPPRVVVGNPTGAGDAASAALAVALARGLPPEDALRRAVALSAAAVAAPLAGDVDPDVLAELEPRVAVRDAT